MTDYQTKTLKRRTDGFLLSSAIMTTSAAALFIPAFIVLLVLESGKAASGTRNVSYLVGLSLFGAIVLYRLILTAIAFFINTWRTSRTMLLIADAGTFLFPFGVYAPYLLSSINGAARWTIFALLALYGIAGFVLYLTLVGFFREYSLTAGYAFFFLGLPFFMKYFCTVSAAGWTLFFAGSVFCFISLLYDNNMAFSWRTVLHTGFTIAGIVLQGVALFIPA